jgi:hypothetical protein
MSSKKNLIINETDSKNIKKYKKAINKFLKICDDNEESHIVQDKIYRQFIKDINRDILTNQEEIKKVASLINLHIIKNDVGRWYA